MNAVMVPVLRARSPWARLRGLLGCEPLPEGHALLLERCRAVHTMGMRRAIDVVFVARDGVVLDLRRAALLEDVEAVTPAARAAGADPWSLVLGGGEDHALVACFPDYPPHGWRVIGAVRTGAPEVLLDGQRWPGPAGWQSFA
jgi:thiamine-monophosphate kinase